MSIKISDVINEIEKIASLSLQEDWDNSGRQISLGDRDVRKVLLCLEVTSNVVEEAIVENGREIGRASCRKECRSRWSPYH